MAPNASAVSHPDRIESTTNPDRIESTTNPDRIESTTNKAIINKAITYSYPNPGEFLRIKTIARGGVTVPFPYKLHIMLDSMDAEATQGKTTGKSIVSWQPHGRAFKVHKKEEFVKLIMPHFFRQSKYASFQRQLNLYGFTRITNRGPDKGAVYHPCFVRNQQELTQNMTRRRIKGNMVRKAILPEHQPNFYAKNELRTIALVDAAIDATAIQSEIKDREQQLRDATAKLSTLLEKYK